MIDQIKECEKKVNKYVWNLCRTINENPNEIIM